MDGDMKAKRIGIWIVALMLMAPFLGIVSFFAFSFLASQGLIKYEGTDFSIFISGLGWSVSPSSPIALVAMGLTILIMFVAGVILLVRSRESKTGSDGNASEV